MRASSDGTKYRRLACMLGQTRRSIMHAGEHECVAVVVVVNDDLGETGHRVNCVT